MFVDASAADVPSSVGIRGQSRCLPPPPPLARAWRLASTRRVPRARAVTAALENFLSPPPIRIWPRQPRTRQTSRYVKRTLGFAHALTVMPKDDRSRFGGRRPGEERSEASSVFSDASPTADLRVTCFAEVQARRQTTACTSSAAPRLVSRVTGRYTRRSADRSPAAARRRRRTFASVGSFQLLRVDGAELYQFGVDINMVAPGGNVTLLSVASEEGSEEAVRALIAAGADVNMASICEMGLRRSTSLLIVGPSRCGRSSRLAAGRKQGQQVWRDAVRMAAQNGHEAVIRALVTAGAVRTRRKLSGTGTTEQLLQRMSGRSLTTMPRAKGSAAPTLALRRVGQFGTGTDGLEAMMKSRKDRSGGEGVNVRGSRVGLKYPTTSPSPPSARRLFATPRLLAWDLDGSAAEASISAATSCCFIATPPRAATAASRTRPSLLLPRRGPATLRLARRRRDVGQRRKRRRRLRRSTPAARPPRAPAPRASCLLLRARQRRAAARCLCAASRWRASRISGRRPGVRCASRRVAPRPRRLRRRARGARAGPATSSAAAFSRAAAGPSGWSRAPRRASLL